MRNKQTVHWAVQSAPLQGPLQWWPASAQHRLLSFSPCHLGKQFIVVAVVVVVVVVVETLAKVHAPSLTKLLPMAFLFQDFDFLIFIVRAVPKARAMIGLQYVRFPPILQSIFPPLSPQLDGNVSVLLLTDYLPLPGEPLQLLALDVHHHQHQHHGGQQHHG